MTRHAAHPDQLMLDWESDPAIQARIEALVAARAEAQSFRWRFQLMVIESVMMGSLVIAAGTALNQPTGMVIRSGFLVAAACFASGMLLIGLTAATALGLRRFRRWWAR
ncbi:hypothetical protein PX554_23815 [Sphingomonas sp. H39-1-10]|jgi:hypothetical protein|uniref:hypothetical protein n=1 Tax=Sphingomonas pollutisoli TaxID=3030829 RepID=UPI0023BA10DE|nr:hypothetical protein [Sphingomonas pollutisoli]MDF0491155.1 hypothetical protein [Sphingomonas pollutisoli]